MLAGILLMIYILILSCLAVLHEYKQVVKKPILMEGHRIMMMGQ